MGGFSLEKLPRIIKVNITKTEAGNFIAEFPEYENVFTQTESLEQLDFNINDLVRAYFDVPKKYHKDIWYRPVKEIRSEADTIKVPLNFQILLAKNFSARWQ